MIRIAQLKLKVNHSKEELYQEIVRQAHGKKPLSYHIVKRSVDARKKPDLYYIYTVDARFSEEKKILFAKKSKWSLPNKVQYQFPFTKQNGSLKKEERPVIVGAGPAGLFAGLVLARAGLSPVIFERGEAVEARTRSVETFFETGKLDTESNVQFGEGGAGTFSDGKLNTLVKDKFGRNHFVLEEFVRHGAPEEILYEAKPHIGTDVLKAVVASLREEILQKGGEIHFHTKVTGLLTKTFGEKQKLCGLLLTGPEKKESEYLCQNVIFAIGHSARDTFSMLDQKAICMTPKSFAIGVRVEHPAALINESQYGKNPPKMLGAASYKLTHQCGNGRGVYSFCMCPGGYVVNSSSEQGRLCVNGMSYHDRGGHNSNSAIITTVTPADFPSAHPLSGMEFQRRYEALAYESCEKKGVVPVQLYGDFKENRPSASLGKVLPCIKGQWQLSNVRSCLPDYVSASLIEGMEAFGRKIKGYNREDALFVGVETRTSSPVRMERDFAFESNLSGLFPCGEGAGYAGGITSAAMDGIKTAEAIAGKILKK